jgi:AcrR family transcriptional regulator
MPKIAAPTIAENREQRREALLKAAADLLLRRGTFTVAEVANEVGLSRTAVYEYYGSAPELIADVLVDELAAWSRTLAADTDPTSDPLHRIQAWIRGVLDYVVQGRHALLRSAGEIDLPLELRGPVQDMHRDVIAPLVDALTSAGVEDPAREARYVWGVVDAAIHRIESGECDPAEEVPAVTAFVDRALIPLLARKTSP